MVSFICHAYDGTAIPIRQLPTSLCHLRGVRILSASSLTPPVCVEIQVSIEGGHRAKTYS